MKYEMEQVTTLSCLKVQARVIGALILREVITRYGRHGIGALWLVVEPMMFTLGIASLWYFVKLHTYSNIPIIAFAITGYSSVLVWRNSANRNVKSIDVNLGLMYHRNVKVLDIMLARILLELGGGTASLAFLTIFFVFVNLMSWPQDILLVIGGWLLLCWFAIAFGLIVGAATEFSETFERVWHVLAYLLFPLSGAIYMVDWLPKSVQELALILPMVHGVEMIRHGYFGELVHTYESPAYFAIFNLFLSLIGLFLTRQASYRVKPE